MSDNHIEPEISQHEEEDHHLTTHSPAVATNTKTHESRPASPPPPKQRSFSVDVPIAKEAWLFIIPQLALSAILWSFGQTTAVVVILFCIAYVLFFFRDLDRTSPQDASLILSPADGKIISITKVREKEFLNEECVRVSIFMSLFDNHINRMPTAGKIAHQNHENGLWLPANSDDAAEKNEKNAIGIEGKKGGIFLVQVAGLIARRIVSRVTVGESLNQGDRFGLIMFGSRVDLYLPAGKVNLKVEKGQRVMGGITTIGSYRD